MSSEPSSCSLLSYAWTICPRIPQATLASEFFELVERPALAREDVDRELSLQRLDEPAVVPFLRILICGAIGIDEAKSTTSFIMSWTSS